MCSDITTQWHHNTVTSQHSQVTSSHHGVASQSGGITIGAGFRPSIHKTINTDECWRRGQAATPTPRASPYDLCRSKLLLLSSWSHFQSRDTFEGFVLRTNTSEEALIALTILFGALDSNLEENGSSLFVVDAKAKIAHAMLHVSLWIFLNLSSLFPVNRINCCIHGVCFG